MNKILMQYYYIATKLETRTKVPTVVRCNKDLSTRKKINMKENMQEKEVYFY